MGGTGTDAAAPANPASQQVITDPAPYKPEAAARVLESFNKRGIDDPAGLCLPLGVPRLGLVGLFPIQIVQTPTQVVILHEYMSVFRVIPLNARAPNRCRPDLHGRFSRSLGGRHARRRCRELQRQRVAQRHGNVSLGRVARDRALHAHRQGSDRLGHHDGGSKRADEAVDGQDDVDAAGRDASPGIRVRREQRGDRALREDPEGRRVRIGADECASRGRMRAPRRLTSPPRPGRLSERRCRRSRRTAGVRQQRSGPARSPSSIRLSHGIPRPRSRNPAATTSA